MLARTSSLLASLALAGCSLLAPSDDELLGGTPGTGGSTSSGGAAGTTSSGGAAGTTAGGGSAGVTTSGGGGAPTGGGGAPTGGGGAPTGGGGAPTGGGGSPSGGGGAPTGGGGTGGTTCQPVSGDATALPRAAYLLLDRSSSMADGQKLSMATAGINAFANGSSASGIELGVQSFGLDTGGTCAGGGYGTPAVGFGSLPALAQAVANSLATLNPGGSTPFEGVLNGSKAAGGTYLASKPGRQLDAVILTDVTQITTGGGCSSSTSLFASIVGSTWPAMATHFVALPGGTKSMLDPLATAGGTVTAAAPISQSAVTDALNRAITPCRFAIPSGHTAAQLSLTLGGQKLSRHSSPTACSFTDGWFEHAGAAVLCPSTCQDLSMGGKVTYAASCG